MDQKLILVLVDVGLGVLWMLLALPLIAARVPRNPFYGFRTPKTMRSDEVWYAANAYFGRCFLHCGRILVAGGLFMWVFRQWMSVGAMTSIHLALLTIPLIVTIILSFRYLSRL